MNLNTQRWKNFYLKNLYKIIMGNKFDKNKMTGRGKGKYMYQTDIRKEGEEFFRQELNQYFKDNKIWYIV